MRPIRVNVFLQRYQEYKWYQNDIYMAEHRLVGPLPFGTTARKKLKYPNMINEKQWKELEKYRQEKRIKTSDTKYVVPLNR